MEGVVIVFHKPYINNQVNFSEASAFIEKSSDSQQVSAKSCDITV